MKQNFYAQRADVAITKYVKAVEKSLRECVQEFTPLLSAYVEWMFSQMLACRAGVYKPPPGAGAHGARALATLTREDARRLCATHDLALLHRRAEEYLMPEHAVYLTLAVLAARKHVAKVERRSHADGLPGFEEMRDHDSPEYEADVTSYLWEQLHAGAAGNGEKIRLSQVPFVRVVMAGKHVREMQKIQAASRSAGSRVLV